MDLKLKSKLENDMSLLSFDFNLRSMADDGKGHKQGDKQGHKRAKREKSRTRTDVHSNSREEGDCVS